MAYYTDPMENEDEIDPSAPVQPSGQSGTLSAGAAGAGSAAPANGGAKSPDRGSNFVGLNKYLNANKAQAGKLGDQAAGVINNSANEARSSVNDLNNTFNQKAGGAIGLDENATNKIGQAETLNDQEKQTIKNQYNAQYTGPNSLTDLNDQYTGAQSKLNAAKTNVQSAGTEEGRKNLITQINSKPRTAGMTNFDNILLSAGGGREKLNAAAEQNKDVTNDVLGQANAQAQQKAQEIKAQTDATRAATQGAVQTAQQNLQKQFDANDKNSKLYQAIQGALSKNNQIAQDLGNQDSLDQATMEMLGLNEGQRLYNTDLNKYFTQLDPNAITKEAVASNEDLLRSQALAELAGGQSFLGSEGIGSYAQMNPLNAQGFKDDLAKMESELMPQYQDLAGGIASAQQSLNSFLSNPAVLQSGGAQWNNGNISFTSPGTQAQYAKLLQAIADQQAKKSQWESNVGYNNVAKRA